MPLQPPELIPFVGSWDVYEEKIYQYFVNTVVNGRLTFEGVRVAVQARPETNGRHFGFWHMISESGKSRKYSEEQRKPDVHRCERILWIAWLIEHSCEEGVSWWKNKRKGKTHIVIWSEAFNYAAILAERKDYYLLRTAYCVEPRRKIKFSKERDEWRAMHGI